MTQLQEWWKSTSRWKRGGKGLVTYHYLHCGTFFVDVARQDTADRRQQTRWTVAVTSPAGGYRHLEPHVFDTLAGAKEHGGRLAEEVLRAALVRIRLASA